MAIFEDLGGKIITKIEGGIGDSRMSFTTKDGEIYSLYHEQDCCESVDINDICGDINDLLNEPILLAEEVSHHNENPESVKKSEWQDSFTWTFYKLSTNKGSVTIRWYGESNGYYSESVDFQKVGE